MSEYYEGLHAQDEDEVQYIFDKLLEMNLTVHKDDIRLILTLHDEYQYSKLPTIEVDLEGDGEE